LEALAENCFRLAEPFILWRFMMIFSFQEEAQDQADEYLFHDFREILSPSTVKNKEYNCG